MPNINPSGKQKVIQDPNIDSPHCDKTGNISANKNKITEKSNPIKYRIGNTSFNPYL